MDIFCQLDARIDLAGHIGGRALALLDEVNHPNLYTYWQPMYWVADADYRFQGLPLHFVSLPPLRVGLSPFGRVEKLAGRVLNLHVFQWLFHPMRGGWGDNMERRSLQDGTEEWRRYLSVELPPGDHYALVEFVADDDRARFLQDAAALRRFLG